MSDDAEKLEGGFYWARHPGGKWQPAHVIDWQETTGETLVELTGEETLWPADEMEIGPRIPLPDQDA